MYCWLYRSHRVSDLWFWKLWFFLQFFLWNITVTCKKSISTMKRNTADIFNKYHFIFSPDIIESFICFFSCWFTRRCWIKCAASFFFWGGYLLKSYFLKKSFKFRLMINEQTVHWQLNQPQEEEIRWSNCVWGWVCCPFH